MTHFSILAPSLVTVVVGGVTLVITSRMGLSPYELAVVLTAVPGLSGLLVANLLYFRKSRNGIQAVELEIQSKWGPALSELQTLTFLSGHRIERANTELEATLQDRATVIYALIAIGYKCVQISGAIHTLCARGFPDQALSLCRGLMEQEANLRFIASIENREEVTERYLDWEKAKTYNHLKDRKKALAGAKLDPPDEEWDALAKEYDRLRAKYRGLGDLGRRDQWAIGTRANGFQVKAFSVEERVRKSRQCSESNDVRLHDAWMDGWQRLNEFTHTTPRSILQSAASNDPKLVVTVPSPLGIDKPLRIAGTSMSNISTVLVNIASDMSSSDPSPQSKELAKQTSGALHRMLEKLKSVPEARALWYEYTQLHEP